MVKIAKFGGSSLADDNQFKKVAGIVKADDSRRYVVPSAPGKRNSEDTKVTDLLYRCYDSVNNPEEFEKVFEVIRERYELIIRGLELKMNLDEEFERIKQSLLHKAGRDYAASRGEYLNGRILSEYLGYEFIDAAEVIFFADDGSFDSERTNEVLSERLSVCKRAVIPGFYGAMPNDTIKTFSRGGSDITGAIVARAANADLYENWTDVSGFLVTDPRIVDNPKSIDIITYRELRELSYMGATVLHEDSIFPVKIAGIPINIRNTNAPDDKGTMIVSSVRDERTPTRISKQADLKQIHNAEGNVVTGIAGKKGFAVLTLEKDMMNEELGFGRRVLEVLENHKLVFEHLPSGIDTMSIVLNARSLAGKEDALIKDLFTVTTADSINIESDIALIAVVGRKMRNARGTAARVFTALAENGINIRMIDQGSSELNIIVGVDCKDFEDSIRTIYKEFVD